MWRPLGLHFLFVTNQNSHMELRPSLNWIAFGKTPFLHHLVSVIDSRMRLIPKLFESLPSLVVQFGLDDNLCFLCPGRYP